MGIFSSNGSLKKGDKVSIKYMGITGHIVDKDNTMYSVEYLDENDKEVIEDFEEKELVKR